MVKVIGCVLLVQLAQALILATFGKAPVWQDEWAIAA
jgi:hypothetical protein